MKTKRLFYIGIMTITISLFPTLLFGQSIFDYEGITYRVIKDADEASTFGTVAVTAKDDGFYEGKITIPNGVKHSEDSYADSYKVVSIDDFAFKGNVTLEEVQLPISIESIGEGAFEGCSKLNHVEIPEGSALSRLGESVFAYSGLESIVFPKGIIELPRFTFRECRRLQQVTLPKSLTKIGVSAFIFCQSLQYVVGAAFCYVSSLQKADLQFRRLQ